MVADNLRGWCSLHLWMVLRAEIRKDLLWAVAEAG